jgi:hypothetical protein
VINESTGLISTRQDVALWTQAVKSLDKVTRDYVGKMWKQPVDLSSVKNSLSNQISFTLTAIDVRRTRAFGDMIAVRSLSQPFFVAVATYQADSTGRPFDLSDVGTDFETLVAEVGKFESILEGYGVFMAISPGRGWSVVYLFMYVGDINLTEACTINLNSEEYIYGV